MITVCKDTAELVAAITRLTRESRAVLLVTTCDDGSYEITAGNSGVETR